MNINFEELIRNIISPLVVYPNDIVIKTIDGDETCYQVFVRKEDIGRVIGKQGKIANAIRTICFAGASKENKKIRIEFDSLENA